MKCQQNITNIPIIKLIRQLKTNSICSKIKISDIRTEKKNIIVKTAQNFSTYLIHLKVLGFFILFFFFNQNQIQVYLHAVIHRQKTNIVLPSLQHLLQLGMILAFKHFKIKCTNATIDCNDSSQQSSNL